MTVAGEIRFTYQPTMADILSTTAWYQRRAPAGIVFSGFMSLTAIAEWYYGAPLIAILFAAATFVALAGALPYPILWLRISRRPDLYLAPVEIRANAQALVVILPIATSQVAWSMYSRAEEASRGFVLERASGGQPTFISSKRHTTEDEINGFRGLLDAVGLFRQETIAQLARKFAVWFGLGILLAAVFQVVVWFAVGWS